MQIETDIKPVEITLSGQIHEMLRVSADAFDQTGDDLVARPMGLDIETCRLAADVCRRLLTGNPQLLKPNELKALFHALEFARRELCSELHDELRDLQKTMASIITARVSGEI